MAFLVLVVMVAYLVDVSQSVCSTGESESCLSTIQGLYENSPNSVSDYHSYCSSVTSTCSSTLTECTCTSGTADEQNCLDFIGFKDAIDWVCTTIASREVYTRNRECITNFADNAALECRVLNMENCEGYLSAFKCFHVTMKSKCSADVADKSLEFALRRYNLLLDNAGCEFGLSDISSTTNRKGDDDSTRVRAIATKRLSDISSSTNRKGDDDSTRVRSIATERKSKSTASTLVSSTAFVTSRTKSTASTLVSSTAFVTPRTKSTASTLVSSTAFVTSRTKSPASTLVSSTAFVTMALIITLM